MRAYPYIPGVPAGGHVTSGGHWHPGAISTCHKCHDCPPFPDSHGPRMRYLHHIEAAPGWEYASRLGDEPPAGKGWELNTDAAEAGHAVTTQGDGTEANVTYWRRTR